MRAWVKDWLDLTFCQGCMHTLAIMSCPCLSLTLVFSVLSRYHCPVIHHNQPCLQVLWQYYQWMMEGYLQWGTTQSVLNVMKTSSCKNTSIQCWSCKGLMWKNSTGSKTSIGMTWQPKWLLIWIELWLWWKIGWWLPIWIESTISTNVKDRHGHDMTAKVCMQP